MAKSGATARAIVVLGLAATGLAIGGMLRRGKAPAGSESPWTAASSSPASAIRQPRVDLPPAPPLFRPILFQDIAAAAGFDFLFERGKRGFPWTPEAMGGGAAWLDVDRDGWTDLVVNQGQRDATGAHDVLFRNRRGRFERCPAEALPEDREYGQGIAAGDFDNDGFEDLCVANFGGKRLYRNNGDGTFSRLPGDGGVGNDRWAVSAAFGDLDGDGFHDAVFANYVSYDASKRCYAPNGKREAYCGPDDFPGSRMDVYRSLGDGRFIDETEAGGFIRPDAKSLGVVIARILDRPLPEVFVANDLKANYLFRNESAAGRFRFAEVASELQCAANGEGQNEANMGIACGDYNGDGRLDLFVTHYYMEQDTLWRNDGARGFRDVSRPAGLSVATRKQLSWGTQFVDFDGDGWLDLFITSGHLNNDPDGTIPYEMPPQVFHNHPTGGGDRGFEEVGVGTGPFFAGRYIGRGSAACDFDRDGRVDVAVIHHHVKSALLQNLSRPRNAIGFEFVGVRAARDGIGVRAILTTPGGKGLPARIVREIIGGGSYTSTDAHEMTIGLGECGGPLSVEIQWPGGGVDRLTGLAPGGRYLIQEGESKPRAATPFGSGGEERTR
ncbi:MAG TPA: CRTAC1 family protein [Planctomycetia bacterium]|nr:CRTAC1 family protein [Planctomycetia bacterium]